LIVYAGGSVSSPVIRRGLLSTGAVLVAAALALTGCGKSNNTNSTTTPSPSGTTSGDPTTPAANSPADLVPAEIKAKGVLNFATDASYAPNEFMDADGKTIIGMDVDLGNAIAEKLGLKTNWQNVDFDSIIIGLAGGKYDIGMSSFTDTKEREKTVDFVTYFTAGTSLLVAKGNPSGLAGPDDLCGHKIAVEKGTTQEADIAAKSKACTDAGKAKVTAVSLPDQNAAALAVQSGRADATLADSPVAEYEASLPDAKFEVAGKSYDDAPYGIAIPKSSGTLKDAILAALKELIADGTYGKILEKWNIADGAISDPVINGALD
jgi:polar amino acid transport system substrate-binding protein